MGQINEYAWTILQHPLLMNFDLELMVTNIYEESTRAEIFVFNAK